MYEAIQKEVKRLKETKEFDELDKAEKRVKDHGRIEMYSSTMKTNTKFLYDEFKNKSFYDEIARIGVIEKETSRKENKEYVTKKNNKLCNNRPTNNINRKFTKYKTIPLEYRSKSLVTRCTIK